MYHDMRVRKGMERMKVSVINDIDYHLFATNLTPRFAATRVNEFIRKLDLVPRHSRSFAERSDEGG